MSLRQHVSDEFRASFHVGLTNYINGLWQQARSALEACDAMLEYMGGEGRAKASKMCGDTIGGVGSGRARHDGRCPSSAVDMCEFR